MTAQNTHGDFSKLRAFFWPVHGFELKKLVPMLFIFFLLNFDYNVLRCMKDTLIITQQHSGAEVIPFIKVWVMFPTSILMTYLYVRLSNRFTKENVFYIMFSIFLSYYFFFTFFIYPNQESLHAHEFADKLQTMLPIGWKGFVAMCRYWTFTSFYVMSELWSNIILFLLFWGFANQVTKIGEAARFYGLFGIGTNLSGIVSGQVSILISEKAFNPNIPLGQDAWGQSLSILLIIVLACGLLAMGFFRWLNVKVIRNEEIRDNVPKERKKLSMRENFRSLSTSKYMLSLALIVISYNIVINLCEILWKHQVRELFPNPRDYNIYMNQVTTIIGILATFSALVVSGNCIRKFGWTFTAMLTPVILLITTIGFFGFFFLKGQTEMIQSMFGIIPLQLVVLFGTMQNCCSRAAKYTVFDATKEMAFVPLTTDEKIKAKAAVDGVCNRLGKSSGSVIYQGLLLYCASIPASMPYVAVILFAVIIVWMYSAKFLGIRFQSLISKNAKVKDEPIQDVEFTAPLIPTLQTV